MLVSVVQARAQLKVKVFVKEKMDENIIATLDSIGIMTVDELKATQLCVPEVEKRAVALKNRQPATLDEVAKKPFIKAAKKFINRKLQKKGRLRDEEAVKRVRSSSELLAKVFVDDSKTTTWQTLKKIFEEVSITPKTRRYKSS